MLADIRRLDPRLHAFAQVFDPPLGEGDGPAFAVKDLIDVEGAPTFGGGRTALSERAERHAQVVERLLAAGLRCVGKTRTVELAYGGWGTNRATGAPWNPWRTEVHHAPGGSSSGSAVAVAAGLCELALGTDTGGSVRIPAALCGVVGLKPGRGLVSLEGVHPLSPSLDTVGVLARDVATAARGLGLIASGRAFDGSAALAAAGGRRLRVAAAPPESLGELHPEVARLYEAALERLADAGVSVETAAPPGVFEDAFGAVTTLMAGEGWRVRGVHIAANAAVMDPWIVRRFEAGRDVSDTALAALLGRRAADQAEMTAWLDGRDALVLPTCPRPAPPIDTVDETVSPMSRLTRPANWLDLPAASVPCGLTSEGLPVGMQFVGRPQGEAGVVEVAAAFERVSGWNGRRPDLSRLD